MRPDQLGDYATPSDPRIHPDGSRAAFVVTRMDLDKDRYDKRIWLWDGETARAFTAGPGDVSPRWSPDGGRLAFLRASGEKRAPAQVAVLSVDGGEAEMVTELEGGVVELAWSPDGTRLAVVAWEYLDGWQGLTQEEREAKPKRITRLPFRFDNIGRLDHRRRHVFIVDPAGNEPPVPVTSGDYHDTEVVWHPSGARLAFTSARHGDRGLDGGTQIWEVAVDGGTPTAATEVGLWELPTYDRDGTLHFIGRPELWSHPSIYPLWRREDDGLLTDLTGDLDRNIHPFAPPVTPAGPRWLEDGSFVVTLEDRGAISAVNLSPDGVKETVIDGRRMVTGIDPRPDGSTAVFVASEPTNPGEVYWWDGEKETRLTHLNDAFRAETHLVEPQPFTIEHDGVEVEGWVYLPAGDGPVPLLLNIHGGPAAQYGYGFFDEFQVYAGAGYGVVASNPRGSTGYGLDHVRAVVGRWQDPAPPDLRDLVAAPDSAAAAYPRLDTSRMGVMGGSYGGFATVRLLAADHRYASAVAERGLFVWTSFAATSDIGPFFDRCYLGAQPPEDWEALWEASPLSCAHNITTPTMVLHSEGDWRCPLEQAEQLFSLLFRAGVDTELVVFPAPEGHELSRSGAPRLRQERFELILDWQERHLL